MTKLRSQFIQHLELRGYAAKTIRNYIQCVSQCSRYFNRSPLTLSHNDIIEYLTYLKRERKLAVRTWNLHYYSIKSFYDHFQPQSNIMHGLKRMKEPVCRPEVLSKEEVEQIIAIAHPLKVKAIIAVLYSAGIRLAECAFLKISDIDSKRMVIRIEKGKGKKDRYAVLSHRTLTLLREYYKKYRPQHWLFENPSKEKPISNRRIHDYVRIMSRESGVRKHVTAHILRHSFATHLLEAGKPLTVIQELLGHADVKTTTMYTHVSAALLHETGSPFDTIPQAKEAPHE